VTLSWRWRSCV